MTQKRLKVLVSAYACEPGKGSEPEVGWQWALQMARFHDVTVLTRANNRSAIERGLASLPPAQPRPGFVYHDLNPALIRLKRLTRSVRWYYLLWQRSARRAVASLHRADAFDLMHHVTIAGYRFPTVIWGHGAATVWGPVGGIVSIPFSLQPWHHPRALGTEFFRALDNCFQTGTLGRLRRRAVQSTTILSSTRDTKRTFAGLGFDSLLMPTIGLPLDGGSYAPRAPYRGPLRCLFVGNIITLKGVDLALDALAASRTDASFTLVGSGDYANAAQRRSNKLKLQARVHFRGRLSRAEVLALYRQYDVYLLPSLHDTGSYALIEAMLNEMPGICLDCGGPAVALTSECGIKVPLNDRGKVVAGLAQALRDYDSDRELLLKHGRAARKRILEHYDWNRKGENMNEVYQETWRRFEATTHR